MKKFGVFLVVFAVFFSFAVVISAQEENTDDAAADEATEQAVEIPGSVDMTLEMKPDKFVMPANFRGGDPDRGLVNALEDVFYEQHEHSILYKEDAGEVAEGASFEGDPNITWDTKVKDADGNFQTVSSVNTNMAGNGGKFFAPGEYQIGNGGARQVGGGEGAEDVATGNEGDEDGGAAGGNQTDEALVGENGETAEGGAKTVTANQAMGVLVHDVTAPDIWIAFQEGAGNIDMAATEQELKNKMVEKIVANLGRPFSQKAEEYEDASYVFVDEGTSDERNLEPWKKTARLSVAGALFNDRGAPKFETKTVESKTLSEENMTRQIHVAGGEDEALKGVFVRRNVPFIFAAMSVDNGNNRGSTAEVACRIETADGKEVEKDGKAYLFRVPNYPREEYKDQPEYFFVSKAMDKSGNLTTVRMPLYIVNIQAAFEGGRNQ
ncbi:MAG: hypothetical protein GQF41_1966 [Candidatus Rifleibacterium amylolyticum]|nr:MAG: hypothetical protein GQF41_1966 [Candidatus Rifleibacterium amylolyticum]